MAKKKNEVVETVKSDVPDYIKTGTKRGSETVGMEDLTIPRLDIVQSLSPCRKKTDPAYIEGAEEGHMFNNVTRELFKDEVHVVPVLFTKEYIIWKDRDNGGGFKGAYPTKEDAQNALTEILSKGKDMGPYDIVDTAQHLCLLLRYTSDMSVVVKVDEIIVSMAKSKMKVSRQWNSMIRINGNDRFSRVYKLSVVPDSSEKGDYFNFKVTTGGFPPKNVYEKAEEIYESISSGEREMKINREVDEATVPDENTAF
jgi:hypothetical protein